MIFDASPIAQAVVQWWITILVALLLFAPGAFLGGWLFALGQFLNKRWIKVFGALYFFCGFVFLVFLLISGGLKNFFKMIQ